MKMNTNELHAYIQGPDTTAVIKWIKTVITNLERKEIVDQTEEIGRLLLKFVGKYELLILEQLVDTGWLELTIRPKAPDSIFTEWDNIQLGERLVDDLGGITLVDCSGIYADPLAPYNVRISEDKMELVELPDEIGDAFDEKRTQLIRRR